MNWNRACQTLVSMLSLSVLAAILGSAGCGKNDDAPKYHHIEGRVSGISPVSNEVKMMWYNEKEKKEVEITGTLAPDSEILINGHTARLEDVMLDDNVEVTGRVEKHNGERKLVAQKVKISRPETGLPATATDPAN